MEKSTQILFSVPSLKLLCLRVLEACDPNELEQFPANVVVGERDIGFQDFSTSKESILAFAQHFGLNVCNGYVRDLLAKQTGSIIDLMPKPTADLENTNQFCSALEMRL